MKSQSGFLLAVAATALFLGGCATIAPAPTDWIDWQARRNESIGGTNGWTTLIGLHWLNEGDNSVGGDSTKQIVLRSPRVPASVGVFTRNGLSVSFAAAPGADVRVEGREVNAVLMVTDATTNRPTRLQIGPVSIIAIQRGERIGLRVRDPESDARKDFQGIRWFPYDPAWRVEGRFVPFPTVKKLRVADVTGDTQEFSSPGQIVFPVGGRDYRLDVADEGESTEFFILFRDSTAGKTTYDSGRFLQVPKPGADGRVVIDFNRAYTPPCAYTAFATCPLPPRQNTLPIAVKAGELKPPNHPR